MCICKGCHVLEKVRAVDNAKFETTNEGSPTGRDKRQKRQTTTISRAMENKCYSRECLQVFIPCHSW